MRTGVWYTADFSGDGDVTAAAVVVDFTEPTTVASASSSGCEASDFGPTVVGRVVLLQRGTCDFGLKVENAQAAGAAAAVIFNEGTIGAADRNDVLIPTLAGYNADIPVVGTDYATGRALVDLIASGQTVTLRVRVDGFVDQDVQTEQRHRRDTGWPRGPDRRRRWRTWTRCTRGRASTMTAPA